MKKKNSLIYADNESKDQILAGTKIIFGILLAAFLLCALTFMAEGNYRFGEEEVEFSTDEIIAGETFNRPESEYYVVFYQASDDNNIVSTIASLTTTKKIYKVDLDNGFNKNIIGDNNKEASKASELQVENPTIIKIVDHENAAYLSGAEKVLEYLNEIY